MNTPLIKPSLIYLINLCDNFKTALFIVMLVVGFAAAVSLYEYLNEEEERRYFSKRFKAFCGYSPKEFMHLSH